VIGVELKHPIGPIASVSVSIPADAEWDAPPFGVDEAIWNMARSTNLTVDQALELHADDIEAIGAAFERAILIWNAGQAAMRGGRR
jgi:hypothetical protein